MRDVCLGAFMVCLIAAEALGQDGRTPDGRTPAAGRPEPQPRPPSGAAAPERAQAEDSERR